MSKITIENLHDYEKALGDPLKELLEIVKNDLRIRNITQLQLSNEMGISSFELSRTFMKDGAGNRGRFTYPKVIKRLCEYYNYDYKKIYFTRIFMPRLLKDSEILNFLPTNTIEIKTTKCGNDIFYTLAWDMSFRMIFTTQTK